MQIKRQKLIKQISTRRSSSIGLSMPKGYTKYNGNWRGIPKELYNKFGAFEHTSKEFLGRINFPIYDATSNIVAFVGRTTVGDVPKYYVYPQDSKLPLFPVVTPLQGSVILVEGIFDMLNMHKNGLTNVVCCFGVKTVTENKLKLLKVSGVTHLYLMMDTDAAGIEANETIRLLCERVELPTSTIYYKEKDPGSLSPEQVKKLKEKLYD